MTKDKIKAIVQGVPMLKCPVCRDHGLRCEEPVPDFDAMAQAVWEAVCSAEECPRNCTTFQQYGVCDHVGREMADVKQERDALRAEVEEFKERMEWWRSRWDKECAEVAQLRALLLTTHPDAHGHEDWLHCAVCAALAPPDAPAQDGETP